MQEVATTATLVEDASFDGGAVTAVLSRRDVEAVLGVDSPALWLELGHEGDEASRVTVQLEPADVEEMLRLSEGDEVVLALDAGGLTGIVEEPDVEAHGLRAALAIAVVAGAIAAPAGYAATPQAASPAAKPQGASAAAAQSQVSRASVQSQVTRQVAKEQVSRAGARAQVSKSLVLKASGIQQLGLQR
jgi:hypothetical protein